MAEVEGRKKTSPFFCHVIPPHPQSESIGGPIIELEERIRIAARKFHAVKEYIFGHFDCLI